MKNLLKKIIPQKYHRPIKNIKGNLLGGYSYKSYSQEGEDMILRRIFEKKTQGFYVDVGAHHPKRFSNTYFFYKKGWRGINIDAMPGSMKLFKVLRKKDINIELPIAREKRELTYYVFDEPAINTFCESTFNKLSLNSEYTFLYTKKINAYPLSDVLDEFMPEGMRIDFLSIDVEGMDYEVLKSNDWVKYRPRVLLIEMLGGKSLNDYHDSIDFFLKGMKYIPFAKTVNTFIYINKKFFSERFYRVNI